MAGTKTHCKRGHLRSDWTFVDKVGCSRCRLCYRESCKRRSRKYQASLTLEELTAQRRRKSQNYLKRHPIKDAARKVVRSAIQKGTMERKPCDSCPETKVEFHHTNGYDKANQLVGKFLCRKHHIEEHNRLRDTRNTKEPK